MTRLLAFALSSLIAVTAVGGADLTLFTDEFNNTRYAEPGFQAKFTVFIRNNGTDAALNATLRVPLPPGSNVVSLQPPDGWTCSNNVAEVICTTPTVPPTGFAISPPFVSVTFTVSPNDDGFVFDSSATITSQTPDSVPVNNDTRVFITTYRMLRVNTTADSGDGSLRSAIENANARCVEDVPCKIKLELPRYSKIAPLTPLPAFEAGAVTIEGNIGRFGDRFIELSGEHLKVGNGLEIHSTQDSRHQAYIQIADMAINNFPQFGVAVTGSDAIVYLRGLFIGTDITGTVARPNSRGVLIDTTRAQVYLSASVVSGNVYSGVYAWNSANLWLTDSLIGIASNGHALGNGKSGVFLYRGSMDIEACTIANNGQFGVSIEPEVTRASVSAAIHDNGILGIDWGLNGQGSSRVPPPVITSATYDAARNQSVISGTIDRANAGGPLLYVDVFASHSRNVQGRAEGELLLGRFVPVHDGDTFTARVPGDFRGQIITATLSVGQYLDSVPLWTSEFSDGVTAQ